MRTILAAAVLVAVFAVRTTFAADSVGPAPVLLWQGTAPGATGDSNEDKPAIYPYLADPAKATGAAILVVPGGGFQTRVIDHEGVLFAQWFRERGISAFVLRYRIRPIGTRPQSIMDQQRAMRFIRSHASEYKISPDRLGTIGFSAGAELINAAANTGGAPDPAATDPIDKLSAQPNFLVLGYGSTATQQPDPATFPPTFMFCTNEDTSHITGMLQVYQALLRARVPVEVHFFPWGEHGAGLANGDAVLGEWPALMFNWIRSGGYLTDKPRVELTGMAMLDGEPLPRGIVSLIPVDSPGAPAVAAFVFNTTPVRGSFKVAQNQGPVPGKYRVEMHQYAVRWMSNSVEPFIVDINRRGRGGLSQEDQQAYLKFARERNLEPSIEGERIYTKAHPGDKDPLIVEIKPGASQELKLEMFSK